MIVPIIASIGILLLFALGGGFYFVYSLISSKTGMNGDSKTKALDIFVYVGIGITLVTSVYNLLQILFTAIDRKYADVLSGVWVDLYSSDMRLAVAFLVVMFPLYVALSWYAARDIAKFLYKRDLFIRKIMVYTTIFITVCSLIGTLISIIYTYLGGELTMRFAAKALTVFAVSFSVFGYYFYSARRDYAKKTYVPTVMAVAASLIVILSIVWSISIVGTPKEMRAKRLDSTRLMDISSIQQEVLNHFQNADKLPVTLSELDDAFQGYVVPVDPVTKKAYEYKVIQQPTVRLNYATNKKEMITNGIFELCATFDTERNVTGQGANVPKIPSLSIDVPYSASSYYYEGNQSPFWNHGVGETCYKRVITPDMYYGK